MEEMEPYLTPAQLARKYPTAHRDYEIRQMCSRSRNQLPHIKRGAKRKVFGIRESVYVLFLEWEEGLIPYDQVVSGARRVPQGARQ